MNTVRLKAILAYDGLPFRGFALQGGQPTVAGSLKAALAKVTGAVGMEIVCAGRTDAGVHATCQVVHVDLQLDDLARFIPDDESLVRLRKSLNKLLGPSISVSTVEVAEEGFNARFSAKARRYRYTILNQETPDPFLASTSWLVKHPLDIHALEVATYPLLGEHDFRSFCRRPPDKKPDDPIIRRVTSAEWRVSGRDGGPTQTESGVGHGSIFTFEIEAGSFCHQMVRSVVGTLVEMGTGRRRPSEMKGIIDAHDRAYASSPAPPNGLCLIAVRY